MSSMESKDSQRLLDRIAQYSQNIKPAAKTVDTRTEFSNFIIGLYSSLFDEKLLSPQEARDALRDAGNEIAKNFKSVEAPSKSAEDVPEPSPIPETKLQESFIRAVKTLKVK